MSRAQFTRITRVTAASILGQAPTAAIPPVIGITLGATAATDGFFVAFAAVSLVVTTLLGAAQHVSVPFFVDAHHRNDSVLPELATVVAMFSLALLLAAGGALALGLSAPGRVGASPTALRDYWSLAPYGLLAALAGLTVSALSAVRDFSSGAMSPAVRSSIVILVLLATAESLGVVGLALGYAGGEACRLAVLAVRVRHCGAGPLRFGRVRATGRAFASRAAVQMVGSGLIAALPLIDRITASVLSPGSVSILDYAERLWQVPVGVVTSGFIVVSLTEWSHHLSTNQTRAGLGATMWRSASVLFGLAIPISLAVVAFRRPIVGLLFAHGQFPLGELGRLADTFGTLVVGTPIYVAGLAYARGFLAFKRTDWLLGVAVCMLTVKVALNLLLAPIWGLVGIAAATGLAYTVATLALAAGFHGWVVRHEPPDGSGARTA